VVPRGENPVKLQALGYEQINSLLDNLIQEAEINLCSLKRIQEVDSAIHSMSAILPHRLKRVFL
jgi:hypothetical protein